MGSHEEILQGRCAFWSPTLALQATSSPWELPLQKWFLLDGARRKKQLVLVWIRSELNSFSNGSTTKL